MGQRRAGAERGGGRARRQPARLSVLHGLLAGTARAGDAAAEHHAYAVISSVARSLFTDWRASDAGNVVQVLSRICHPNVEVFKVVEQIILKVLLAYPQQVG